MINSDGIISLMQDFEDMQNPRRGPSPVRIWQVSGDSEISFDRIGGLPTPTTVYSEPIRSLA